MKNQKYKSGMTLVEVMVATVLVVLGLTAFLTGFTAIQQTSNMSNNKLAAMHRAREIVEYVTTEKYKSSALNIGTHTLPDATYIVSYATGHHDVKNISVTVPWQTPLINSTYDLTLHGSISLCLH